MTEPRPLPAIIYGTAWKAGDTARLVETALARGFRGIDTAAQPKHYDEAGVGAGLAAAFAKGLNRSDVHIQTKFTSVSGHDPQRIPYDPAAPIATQVAQSFASSQRNLGVERLDAVILHSPLATRALTLEVWTALEALVDRGEVARLGISNCYDRDLLEWLHGAARVKPTLVQNRFYAQTGYDRGIRAFCRAHAIAYQSFWTLTANPALLASEPVTAAARAYGRTPAQVLFRWLAHEGVVPLTGTRSIEHMAQDLEILGFELNSDERAAINSLLDASVV